MIRVDSVSAARQRRQWRSAPYGAGSAAMPLPAPPLLIAMLFTLLRRFRLFDDGCFLHATPLRLLPLFTRRRR
jgi:hypothetical protein